NWVSSRRIIKSDCWRRAITGWASVAHGNGRSETDLFPDKTQLTAFNCTIQINCPQSANTSDAGTTITEEKKDEDSGWCSIVSVN
ncbi:MAG: hypothetical protein ACPL7I_07655, partial [Myxococcota bacterium]